MARKSMSSTRYCIVLLLAFACASLAQGPAQGASPEEDNTFRLEGTVINSVTRQPIARALVQITTTPPRAMLTGAEGEFFFDKLPQSTVYVQVTKPGFNPPGYNGSVGRSTPRSLVIGPGMSKAVLALTPEAVIYGQVTDAGDDPVEGVMVDVLNSRTIRGHQHVASAFRAGVGLGNIAVAQVQTDEDGKYRIAGLAPGTYYIMLKTTMLRLRSRAQAREGLHQAQDSGAYPAVLYYPGANHFDSALPVQLAGGQRLETDFELKHVPSFSVAGVVSSSGEWKQINPPMITDTASGQTLLNADTFAETGAFTFKAVPAGTYSVTLAGTDQMGMYHSVARKLVVAGPITNARLQLPAPVTISVVVHNELTKPRNTGVCTSTGPDGKIHRSDCSDQPLVVVQLDSVDSHTSSNTLSYGRKLDPDNFKLQGVMPGRYWVVAAQFGGYVAALRSGSVDLLRDPLVVPTEGGVPPIEVTLRDDTAAVKLQLRSDTAGQQGWAVLVPDLLGRDPIVLDLKSGMDRDYSGIAPGSYKVFAVDSRDGINFSDPQSYEQYLNGATSVTLTANGSTTVPVTLQHTED